MTIDRTDRELLMSHVLEKPRSWVIAHAEEALDPHQSSMLQTLIERRESGEPLSYLTGTKEFFGREFAVTRDTLIPRPATEQIVQSALSFLRNNEVKTHEIDSKISAYVCRFSNTPIETVLDIGTGCGCIAITLALEEVTQSIIAIDTSKAALSIAMQNAKKFGADRVQLTKAEGVNVVRNFHRPFLLVSNPPYIPVGTKLDKTVQDFEPHSALFAGPEGLNVITPLLIAARGNVNCVGVVMEMRTEQVPA
jgi:release factor glutamine methyltransferase